VEYTPSAVTTSRMTRKPKTSLLKIVIFAMVRRVTEVVKMGY